jgi:hypothetical protein
MSLDRARVRDQQGKRCPSLWTGNTNHRGVQDLDKSRAGERGRVSKSWTGQAQERASKTWTGASKIRTVSGAVRGQAQESKAGCPNFGRCCRRTKGTVRGLDAFVAKASSQGPSKAWTLLLREPNRPRLGRFCCGSQGAKDCPRLGRFCRGAREPRTVQGLDAFIAGAGTKPSKAWTLLLAKPGSQGPSKAWTLLLAKVRKSNRPRLGRFRAGEPRTV